jgi:hypothetical protein
LALNATAAEPVKATLALKNKTRKDVEIVSRDAKGWLYYREPGKKIDVGIVTSDIESLVFPVQVDRDKLESLYSQAQYKEYADLLVATLRPTFPFVDLPTNVGGLTCFYLKARCWEGQYQEVLDVATVMARSAETNFMQQARAYRSLAYVGLQKLNEADAELKKIGTVTSKDDFAPLYWYALTQLQLARNDWQSAQENAARMVAFCGKELEWLLPGSYLSAKCYAHAKRDANVAQIASEMNQMYPKSRWTALTSQLSTNLPNPDKGANP